MRHGGKRVGAGRKPGPKPQSRVAIEGFARSVVEDPVVQTQMRQQAREGTLPVPLVQMLFGYAYGRPRERLVEDEAFLDALIAVMLKHATTPEARQAIRDVIEAHTGLRPLRVVA